LLSEEGSVSEESLNSMAKSNTCNCISSNVVPELTPSGSHFKIDVIVLGRNQSAPVAAMVDCGATGLFISKRFVQENRVRTSL
jgi:hypothetical protein